MASRTVPNEEAHIGSFAVDSVIAIPASAEAGSSRRPRTAQKALCTILGVPFWLPFQDSRLSALWTRIPSPFEMPASIRARPTHLGFAGRLRGAWGPMLQTSLFQSTRDLRGSLR